MAKRLRLLAIGRLVWADWEQSWVGWVREISLKEIGLRRLIVENVAWHVLAISTGMRAAFAGWSGEYFCKRGFVEATALKRMRAAPRGKFWHMPLVVLALLSPACRTGIMGHNQTNLADPWIAFQFG